ncbi:sialate O-acetylesterase [Dysgonomonas alginatilytica]|uniref:Sialate O-acetylesterase n=1 Tax=Dysgonomonas alginatilytica TaxID=1605892 RepID=A0A2V3PKN1_9BACT|nr:sialate O-acetylesterase [Dysgonomonas alginatilytica]PXV59983.1 sialate O-acetylesterase [Dysgonomonas alginatilytica]
MKEKIILSVYIIFISISVTAANLRLSPLFSDYMIVQRDAPVKIYGKGIPGNNVEINFEGAGFQTKIEKDSSWLITLPEFALNKNYTISVYSGEDSVQLKEVVAGDVWLCSGQSNMEFQMANFPWCDEEIKNAKDPDLRFYSVPNSIDMIPAKDLVEGGHWKQALGNDLRQCSATAYFFAKNIRKEVDVPIGIICSDWSGTGLEPWMSVDAIKKFPQFEKEYKEFTSHNKSRKQIEADFKELRKTWDKEYYLTGKGFDEKWYLPSTDFSDWTPYKPSEGYWENANIGLDKFDGVVWFQTTFDLPDDYKEGDFHLFLSYIKDYNITWVNGVTVGEVFGDKNWSDYYVSQNILKKKDNVLVVRVLNVEGNGGFSFHPFWATPILNGQWYCRKDEPLKDNFVVPHIVNVNPFSHPAILYNSMINPLAENVKIRGVIWYQGESNAGRGYEYRYLFPEMITDWRRKFNIPEMPFYFVQLANYDSIDTSGNNNDWSELRESQDLATKLPHVKMATAIDLGEEKDIHPKNKQDVGLRLAELALADSYGVLKEKEYPRIKTVGFTEGKASVQLDSDFIILNDQQFIKGFSIAGADEQFYPAIAEKDGNLITVYSEKVQNPQAVRYAWSKNPGELNLYGKNSLPVLPYRSDNWKGITDDRVYDPDIVYF